MTTILITTASGMGYPSFIRYLKTSLGKEYRIIGTAAQEDAVGFAFLDKGYLTPKAEDGKNYLNALLEICQKEKVKLLLPVAPQELLLIASNINKFQKINTMVLISPLESLRIAENKYKLFNFCKKKKIPVPKFIKAKDYKEFKKAVFDLGYPEKEVCFKPTISSGTRGFRVLSEKDDKLIRLFKNQPDSTLADFKEVCSILKEAKSFPDLLVMEFLIGQEYTVDILADQGRPLIIVPRTRKKIVLGTSFVGEVVKEKDIIRYSKNIVKELKLNGIVGIQFKKDKNNIPKVLEVNPRVQGGTILAVAAGANLGYLAIKNTLRENWKVPKIQWGTKLIRYYDEVYQDKKGRFFKL